MIFGADPSSVHGGLGQAEELRVDEHHAGATMVEDIGDRVASSRC